MEGTGRKDYTVNYKIRRRPQGSDIDTRRTRDEECRGKIHARIIVKYQLIFFPFCLAWTAYVGAIAWLRNGIRFEGKNGAGWLFCGLDYTAR